jgi:DNA-binding CsgD family transcriptional regulator
MWKTVLLYGGLLAILTFVLKSIEYRYLIRDISTDAMIGVLAAVFIGLGIWTGLRLSRKRVVLLHPDFRRDESALQRLGISPREMEVLELIAQGRSNEEIANDLFVSLSTVKTHIASLFLKLNARRRTHALQKAREFRLIP